METGNLQNYLVGALIVVLMGSTGFFGVKTSTYQDLYNTAEKKRKALEEKVQPLQDANERNRQLIDSLTLNIALNEARREENRNETAARVDSVKHLNTQQLREYFAKRYHLP